MAKTVMLSDDERELLAALLASREEAIDALKKQMAKDESEDGNAAYDGWSPATKLAAKEVIKRNQRIVSWNERVLSQRDICDEENGIAGAPIASINAAKIDFTDRELVFAWNMVGEDFLPVDPQYVYPAELVEEDSMDDEHLEYLNCLRHAAKTGWPLLTRKQAKMAELIRKSFKEAEHFFTDLLEHASPPNRSKRS
jgi:hypothetical protein